MPHRTDTPVAVAGVRALEPGGDFSAPTRVAWSDGTFALDGESVEPGESVESTEPIAAGSGESDGRPDFDGSGLWLIPGIVDAHLHAAWHDFMPEDRKRATPEERLAQTAAALHRTLLSGITSVRDAGGLAPRSTGAGAALPDAVALPAELPGAEFPRVQTSIAMLSREAADREGGLDRAVDRVLEAGADWVKLVATAGVAAPPGTPLDPVFTRAEMSDAVRRADAAGSGVMVHAWGGEAIDDAIATGACSIEHGLFLTDDQARRAADRGMTLVPTLRIYRLVQRMIVAGDLPAAFRSRVDEAVGEHPAAVRRARDAGLPIALGTDYGTAEQHGTNRHEFDALVEAGLAPAEALDAATRVGAELLGRVAQRSGPVPGGRIADGELADAVLLRRDPREPGALSDPGSIVAVIRDGVFIETASARDASTTHERNQL